MGYIWFIVCNDVIVTFKYLNCHDFEYSMKLTNRLQSGLLFCNK